MSERRQIFTDHKRELDVEELKEGQKRNSGGFLKKKAEENRNERYDLEMYGDKIKI